MNHNHTNAMVAIFAAIIMMSRTSFAVEKELQLLNQSLESLARLSHVSTYEVTKFKSTGVNALLEEVNSYFKTYDKLCKVSQDVDSCQQALLGLIENLSEIYTEIVKKMANILKGRIQFEHDRSNIYTSFLFPAKNVLNDMWDRWKALHRTSERLNCDDLDVVYRSLQRLRTSAEEKEATLQVFPLVENSSE